MLGDNPPPPEYSELNPIPCNEGPLADMAALAQTTSAPVE